MSFSRDHASSRSCGRGPRAGTGRPETPAYPRSPPRRHARAVCSIPVRRPNTRSRRSRPAAGPAAAPPKPRIWRASIVSHRVSKYRKFPVSTATAPTDSRTLPLLTRSQSTEPVRAFATSGVGIIKAYRFRRLPFGECRRRKRGVKKPRDAERRDLPRRRHKCVHSRAQSLSAAGSDGSADDTPSQNSRILPTA